MRSSLHSHCLIDIEHNNISCCSVVLSLSCYSDEENDEDQNGLYYLPAAPEVDDPEETVNPDVRTLIDKIELK